MNQLHCPRQQCSRGDGHLCQEHTSQRRGNAAPTEDDLADANSNAVTFPARGVVAKTRTMTGQLQPFHVRLAQLFFTNATHQRHHLQHQLVLSKIVASFQQPAPASRRVTHPCRQRRRELGRVHCIHVAKMSAVV